MKKAKRKQLIYIEQLKRYLHNYNKNIKTTYQIDIESNMKLSYEQADKKIKDLICKLNSLGLEHSINLDKNIDNRTIIKTPVQFVENYKELNSFTIDRDKKKIILKTSEGETIEFELSDRLINEDNKYIISPLYIYSKCSKAINYNKRINIFKVKYKQPIIDNNNKHYEMYGLMLENTDDIKERKKQLVEIRNKILEVTDHKVPYDNSEDHVRHCYRENFSKIFSYIEKNDIKLYEKLESKEYINDSNKAEELASIFYDSTLVSTYDKVEYI
ncbi:hypothetical protein [Senegalia massiliensis]|uniref:Uncharacterized protein n=1 Tax=Senegalia massiliensis TaxID=1720316 RepID=A0A845QZF6_9CLOT|nr:hypothetical protein [Senegalia massiliensis]NBI07550.1 hypothetical protein [Senegalia massiliensis]